MGITAWGTVYVLQYVCMLQYGLEYLGYSMWVTVCVSLNGLQCGLQYVSLHGLQYMCYSMCVLQYEEESKRVRGG